MASYFLDSSAVVKCYAVERGSAWIRRLAARAAGNHLFLAQTTGADVVSALVRHRPALARADLAVAIAQFQRDFMQRRVRRIAITRNVVFRAMALAIKHHLRGYDAIQLAAATEAHSRAQTLRLSSLTFVSGDLDLNAAAASEGLPVDDPNQHP